MATDTAARPAAELPVPSEEQEQRALRHLHDVPVDVGVQLDRRRITVREVLDLTVGSVVTLERSAGENVDLLLNGVIVGNGEIVVIEDMMGLRITDLSLGEDSPAGG